MTPDRSHPTAVQELRTTSDVRTRYRLAGPHVTAAIQVPAPGSGIDAHESRWHSAEHELTKAHASRAALEQLKAAFFSLPPTGDTFLLTANADSAAWCRLEGDSQLDFAVVARAPRLLPALAEVERRDPVVAALVDRVGADVYTVAGGHANAVLTVEGDTEFIHRGAAGGWSQPRYQKRAENTWSMNAKLVAQRLAEEFDDLGAELLVVSGDERAVGLLMDALPTEIRESTHRVQAGGRHESDSVSRLEKAVADVATERLARQRAKWLARLAEEVGQGDRGCLGLGPASEQIMAGLVDVLFVVNDVPNHDYYDLAVARAFETGAEVVVVAPDEPLMVNKEIGALLRRSSFGSAGSERSSESVS